MSRSNSHFAQIFIYQACHYITLGATLIIFNNMKILNPYKLISYVNRISVSSLMLVTNRLKKKICYFITDLSDSNVREI